MKKIQLKESDKKFILVTAAVTILSVAFLVLVPIQMNWSGIQETKKEIAAKEKELETAHEKEKNLPQLRAAIVQAEEEIQYVEARLPNSRDVPRLLAELNEIATREEIAYAEMETLETREFDRYVEIPLRIVLRSPYHDLGRFLNNVENSDRFSKIDGIQIDWDPEEPEMHEVNLTLSTFMFVEKPEPENTGNSARGNARNASR